jgi:hypothetical protein
MYIHPIPNGFQGRAISLYSSKIVDKKEILRTVSHTGSYCSSDKVGTLPNIIYFRKFHYHIGQGEARHRKYKRLKLGGGHAYDRSSD